MNADSVEISLLAPGVYLVTVDEPATDAVVVNRTVAAAAWIAVADVVIDPRRDDDVEQLIAITALRYHVTVSTAISSARRRSGG